MDVSRVKYNLGRTVSFHGGKYIFNALIIRTNSKGFYYQAELKSQTAKSSLIIAALDKVEEGE